MNFEEPKDGQTFTTNPVEGEGGIEDQKIFGMTPSVELNGQPRVLNEEIVSNKAPEVVIDEIEVGDENQEVDTQAESVKILEALKENTESIARLKELLDKDTEALRSVRAGLGIPDEGADISKSEERLEELERQRDALLEEEEKIESAKAMNEVLERLNRLEKSELETVRNTGRDSKGEKIVGPGGRKIEPDVAKQLAGYAEKGIKKITKFMLQSIGALVKGVFKAIFEVATGKETS